ncbi:PREDICTED: serine/threonine-protein kinase 31 [Apaloderma vittatum]|uniref:serine/threonine-protein kinase 31 n=1 Tax=Apaloderma vittatum TaxID=57397 RepID=UPI0005216BBD|nr:PREDICTED: serine/threonine-protein kinase 31 [Apaloderma vittatum]
MDEGTVYDKVEDVVGCHVEDAVTFWAQNVNRCNDLLKLSCALAEACPRANGVFGKLDFSKIYGGCFSEDKCWYRCMIQQVINNEKCQVLYIDYGNSEVLNRSDIVEIPPDLQCPTVAKKYRLWGLQIPADQNLNMFDQGRKFLSSLVFEKRLKIRHKAKHEDGTIFAQAEDESIDIGEQVARAGFAEKWMSPGNTEDAEKREVAVMQNEHGDIKGSLPLRRNRSNSLLYSMPGGRFDLVASRMKNQNFAGNRMFAPKEKTPASLSVPDTRLSRIRPDQNLFEEREGLRRENVTLLQKQKELELKVRQLEHELEVRGNAKEASRKTAESFEEAQRTCIGMKMTSLAAKMKALKGVRCKNKKNCFEEQVSQAIKVVTEGCLTVPCSLEKLRKIWTEYDLAQDRIQLCRNVDERNELITKRDEVQQNLYSAVREFILEVDQLPLSERLRTLQELSASLEMVYGQASEADDSEDVFQQFFDWKSIKMKKLIGVRGAVDTALQILADWFSDTLMCFNLMSEASSDLEEVVVKADEILEKVELAICEELATDINEHDEAEKRIIRSAYNTVIHKICQEQNMIAVIQNGYLASVEFKNHAEEWLNRRPDINNLLSIKKTVKSLKAQLRWKLVEKNNFEESDDYSELEMTRMKEKIADLRNRVLEEVSKEQEEYEKLIYLVQKWFPELPLLYPEVGFLNYMKTGRLLTHSLERDLLDAEPLKELSTKRPLLCSEMQGQKVLLKGYFVDVSSEAKVIERMAKYHRAWDQQKEKSGLLQLLFLLFCKSDALVYLVVPYYPGASLGAFQADTPLTLEEALKVMKGVAQGLQTLHGADIVHGSLHENNIFAVNRERGIVGDFDFTKSEEQRAAANTMNVGTLSLVSPELRAGQPASPASDMYAYGCLLLWDDKVKSLLLNLFCCNRLTAEQVVRDDCFLLVDGISVSPQPDEEREPCEKLDWEKTVEKEMQLTEENGANPAQ